MLNNLFDSVVGSGRIGACGSDYKASEQSWDYHQEKQLSMLWSWKLLLKRFGVGYQRCLRMQ